jgi:transcriptional regulator with XRE-family HTH domain
VTTPREQLGSKLRHLRLRAGLSGDALAEQAGLSQSKVSRVERGLSLPSVDELRAWTGTTQATTDELTEIAGLVEQVAATSWRILHRLGLSEKQREIAELEQQAASIHTFQPVVVPGLLQVAEYARRTMSMGYSGEADAKAVVARIERQSILYDTSKQFDFLITEGALRWCPQDFDMRPQLDRLMSVSSLPNVNVSIVPFENARTVFLNQFVIWHLEAETVVSAETYSAELWATEPHDVARYQDVWERLSASAVEGGEWIRRQTR